MEKIFYEAKPYLCAGLGVFAMGFATNNYGRVAALVLIARAITIFSYRRRTRSDS